MNLLLDTHIALWAITDSPRLSPRARELIEAPRARQPGDHHLRSRRIVTLTSIAQPNVQNVVAFRAADLGRL